MYEYIIPHNVGIIYNIFISIIFSSCEVGFQGCIFLATNQHGETIYLRRIPGEDKYHLYLHIPNYSSGGLQYSCSYVSYKLIITSETNITVQ